MSHHVRPVGSLSVTKFLKHCASGYILRQLKAGNCKCNMVKNQNISNCTILVLASNLLTDVCKEAANDMLLATNQTLLVASFFPPAMDLTKLPPKSIANVCPLRKQWKEYNGRGVDGTEYGNENASCNENRNKQL